MDRGRIDEIKKSVLIPDYFDKIIVPQMGDYYSLYRPNFEVRPFVLCPIHGEEEPSMKYYEETNTVHCFGCGFTGDIISLHRKFTEIMTGKYPSFKESLTFLYDYFIKGKENIDYKPKIIEIEKESNPVDLLRLSNKLYNIERQVILDKEMSLEDKKKIWDLLDNIDILVSKHIITAGDVLRHINFVVENRGLKI